MALGAATVLTGLMAGFFYTYACSVMVGLAITDDRTFIATMQAINATVRNPAFGIIFFGALVTSAGAAAVTFRTSALTRAMALGATLLYVGAFLVTMSVSVPLNETLEAAGPATAIADAEAVRTAYEGPWGEANLLRTALTLGAFIFTLSALVSTICNRRLT